MLWQCVYPHSSALLFPETQQSLPLSVYLPGTEAASHLPLSVVLNLAVVLALCYVCYVLLMNLLTSPNKFVVKGEKHLYHWTAVTIKYRESTDWISVFLDTLSSLFRDPLLLPLQLPFST